MNRLTGRPDHIQDWLVKQHEGCWFMFDGGMEYSNLILLDETKTLPTEAECNQGLADLQAKFDAKQYQRDRQYPSIGDQLDMIFHAGEGGAEFQAAIQAVKDAHPKPE